MTSCSCEVSLFMGRKLDPGRVLGEGGLEGQVRRPEGREVKGKVRGEVRWCVCVGCGEVSYGKKWTSR